VHPEGYGYSRFCGLYQRLAAGKQDVVPSPGTPALARRGFVDWGRCHEIPVHRSGLPAQVWASLAVRDGVGARVSYNLCRSHPGPAVGCLDPALTFMPVNTFFLEFPDF